MSQDFSEGQSRLFYAVKLDQQGCIRAVNTLFKEHFAGNEWEGKAFTEYLSEKSVKLFLDAMEKIKSGEDAGILQMTLCGLFPCGRTTYHLNWEIHPYTTEDKSEAYRLTGIMLADQEDGFNRYQSVFEQATDAIMVTDFEGNFLDVNPWLCNIFGYTRQELLGMNINQLIDPDELKHRPILFNNIAAGKHVFSERRMMKRNGDIVLVEANVKAIEKNLILAIARDITVRKEVEKEKEKISEQLQERIKELRTLYQCSQIIQNENKEADEVLQGVVNALPHAYRYADDATVRLTLGDKIYISEGFAESSAMQTETFRTRNGSEGKIEVAYHQNVCRQETDLFLNEERSLLIMIADMIRIYLSRKYESDALRKSEANLQTIFNNTGIGFTLLDKNFNVVYFNQASKNFAINELKAVVYAGMPLKNYFDAHAPEYYEGFVSELIAGNVLNYEKVYKQADGTNNWYQTQVFPIKDNESGGVLGYTIAVTDITVQKENEVRIQKQLDVLSGISFITSHELRHEYTKLHAVIDMVKQADVITPEDKVVLSESEQILNNIDKVIYKLNDHIVSGKATPSAGHENAA